MNGVVEAVAKRSGLSVDETAEILKGFLAALARAEAQHTNTGTTTGKGER